MDRIYLDYAATTPVDKRVIETMVPFFDGVFGNPSSAHYFGQMAEGEVESARNQISNLFHSPGYEVIFTSGGSESDNLAIRGAALAARKNRGADRILISSVEHEAINKTAHQLQNEYGFKIDKLRVDNNGQLDIHYLEEILDEKTALVSVIYGNNEIGTINPIVEISTICHKKGIIFHTDAVQAEAHINIDLQQIDADLLSISAHKFYGPKGIGALIKKRSVDLTPQITGGKQEGDFRAGTHNVPNIVGFAKALEIKSTRNNNESLRLSKLRDLLISEVLDSIPDCQLTGHPTNRLPNHASFVFSGIDGNELLITLDMAGFAVSSGSACKVGNPTASEVLLALGINQQLAMGSLRITFGRMTTEEHIEKILDTLPIVIDKLRHGKGK